MDNEISNIEIYKLRVEEKLVWGSSDEWRNGDFDKLSELILGKTGVSLSATTLKRIWGKVKYDSTPTLSTLDALAQFIDCENWRDFVNKQHKEAKIFVETKTEEQSKIKIPKWLFPVIGISIILGILFWNSLSEKTTKLTYKNVSFKSKPVSFGVPNTVVFEYNAADSNADSVFIQQNWDSSRRTKVDKSQYEFTSVYYTPGYYRAKLILNDSIVKEHDLFIEADGWIGTIDYKPVPTYLSKTQIQKNDLIGFSEKEITAQGIDLRKESVWTSFHNVSKPLVVPSQNLSFETEIRNTSILGKGFCKETQILILGSEGAIGIPLSIKGCVGEVDFFYGGNYFDGKSTNLSEFGVDFTDFVNVKCKVREGTITISINDKPVHQNAFNEGIGNVVGARIRFMNGGEIRKFEIREAE